jgi:hypothetical protein
MSVEQRLDQAPGPTDPGRRRAADRHYLAVVAAEARRLARQLRPPAAPRVRPGVQIRDEGRAEALA